MRGATPPLPHTPSWRCAQLKHGDNFTLRLGFYFSGDEQLDCTI